MKKNYDAFQMDIVLFDKADVIVASSVEEDATTQFTYNKGNDETEIL